MKRIFALGAALALALSLALVGCGDSEVPDVAGKKGDEARKALMDAGFYTIELVGEDGSAAYVASLYTVVSQEPQAGTMAGSSTKIVLTVRDEAKTEREESDRVANEARKAIDALVGSPAAEAYSQLVEQGYEVVLMQGGRNCTSAVVDGAEDPDDPLVVTGCLVFNYGKQYVMLSVNDQAGIDRQAVDDAARAALEEKLPLYVAWGAVQRCGDDSYPYGFDVHQFFGVLEESVQDESTWYLRAECDVVTEYGETWSAVCEATVTGTKDDPLVTSFLVYG